MSDPFFLSRLVAASQPAHSATVFFCSLVLSRPIGKRGEAKNDIATACISSERQRAVFRLPWNGIWVTGLDIALRKVPLGSVLAG